VKKIKAKTAFGWSGLIKGGITVPDFKLTTDDNVIFKQIMDSNVQPSLFN